ncbi:hypothetical protein JCM8097_003069 [Rhodosporidiobolus ruineniae]
MPIVHIVLWKLNGEQPSTHISTLQQAARAMVGTIPGLRKCDLGPPLESTKHRNAGWELMLYAELDDESALALYADHPAHVAFKELTAPYNVEVMAFDIESPL